MMEFLTDDSGVFLRRGVLTYGVDDAALQRLLRAHQIVRLRHGVYATAQAWQEADRAQRHVMLARGVMRLYPPRVALSHASACVMMGGPSWGLDLSQVHLTDLTRHGERKRARVVHHRGDLRVNDVSRIGEAWITAPTRTALDAASVAPIAPAVAVLDHFLHRGLTTLAELETALDQRECWPDHLDLAMKISWADGSSESVAESRLRVILQQLGLGPVLSQYEVRTAYGRLIGHSDFALPHQRLLIEFDGREKYARYRRPGETMEEFVMREKRREDRMREATGYVVVRIMWEDLDRPHEILQRLQAAARASLVA